MAVEQRLDKLFDRLFRMSDAELRLLRLGWTEISASDREAAWRMVRATIRSQRRAELMESARSTLAEWVNNYLSATSIEYGSFLINSGSGMDPVEVRRGAIPAVMDAVAAIVAEEGLSDDERSTLLGPWQQLRTHQRS